MKVTRIILLATSAAIGANAQVLKRTALSNPRRRFNKMKEADRRRLQTTITCTGIGGSSAKTVNVNGYGAGCKQQAVPVDCSSGGSKQCKANNVGYNECFDDGTSPTNTCVCIIPISSSKSKCTGDFGGTSARPCCTKG